MRGKTVNIVKNITGFLPVFCLAFLTIDIIKPITAGKKEIIALNNPNTILSAKAIPLPKPSGSKYAPINQTSENKVASENNIIVIILNVVISLLLLFSIIPPLQE